MYCGKCGKEIPDGARFCDNCHAEPKSPAMKYVSVVLAILSVILPFLKWLEVPVAKGLYSMFGMADQTPTFSLFGYLFAGNQYQSDTVWWVMIVIALIAFIGIVFNLIYAVKALRNKPNYYKYGTMGAIILTIMSVLFILIVGLMSLILKVIKLSAMPYVTLAVSIANIVIIKKLKKQTKQGGSVNVEQ